MHEPSAEQFVGPARLTRAPQWHLYTIWSAFALFAIGAFILSGPEPYDPDAYMRLQQVRDLLQGQGWFDVTQYRMDPARGASMHWSRIVDLPIAGLILLFGTILPPVQAEQWAMAVLPLLYFGACLALLRAIMLRLGLDAKFVAVGLAFTALCPLLPPAFAPLMIDHHSPQALAMLASAYLFLRPERRWPPALAGTICAVWLNISLEGAPVVGLFGFLYGLRYVQRRARDLPFFLSALAIAAPLLSFATRPWQEFLVWCDILLPAHCAAIAAAAILCAILPAMPRQDRLMYRFAGLSAIALTSAAVGFALLGPCAAAPFSALDPVLTQYWYRNVLEGQPFWLQPPDTAAMMLSAPALLAAACWLLHKRLRRSQPERQVWRDFAMLSAGIVLYGLVLLREMVMAQLLLAPFIAVLFWQAFPKARAIPSLLPRVIASVAVVFLVTPLGPTLAGKGLSGLLAKEAPGMRVASAVQQAPCDFAALNMLPQGHVFNTHNGGPAIMVRSHHTVEMGGYHRNHQGLRDVIDAFIGTPDAARAILTAKGADYLAVCLDDASLQIFAGNRPGSLAALLLRDAAPPWLVPQASFDKAETALRVYEVR